MNTSPLSFLEQGQKAAWIAWREQNPCATAEFSQAKLQRANLRSWPLAGVKLRGADLTDADLRDTDLSGADLTGADLSRAKLGGAKLIQATLNDAYLIGAYLQRTDFTGARLERANLYQARFYRTVFRDAWLQEAILTGTRLKCVDFTAARLQKANLNGAELNRGKLCEAILNQAWLEKARLLEVDLKGASIQEAFVYGISTWGLINADRATQRDLLITPLGEAEIRVDDLELAQFVYLILRNEKIRNLINVMTSKVVLILGSFQPQHKKILESVKDALRNDDFAPILFDFEASPKRDLTETIQILAGLAHFVIADLTSAKSVIEELSVILHAFPSLPIQPILQAGDSAFILMKDLRKRHPWLRPEFYYQDGSDLLRNLRSRVIQPAENWRLEWKEMAAARNTIEKLQSENDELRRKLLESQQIRS